MEFIHDPVAHTIVESLIRGTKDFVDIDTTRLLCTKEISGKMMYRKVADVKPVAPPFNLLNPNIMYILCVYSKYWDLLSEEDQRRYLYHQLMHIREFDGKLATHNVEDFKEVIDTYGFADPDR